MQTIVFRLIRGIVLLPAAAGRIIECPNLTAVSGRIPAEKTHNTDKSAA